MVYIDLDNTLVCVREQLAAATDGGWTEFAVGHVRFSGVARPRVHEFLGALRALGPVRLLTFSRRTFALMVCHQFRLGFMPAEILAQEDWWGGFLSGPLRRESKSGNAEVLVANVSDPMNESKLLWLGPTAQLVAVPDFSGMDDSFAWLNCVATVRDLLRS